MRANRIHLRCASANAAVEAAALPRFEDLRALRVRRKRPLARRGKESFLVDENRNPWLRGKDTPRYPVFFRYEATKCRGAAIYVRVLEEEQFGKNAPSLGQKSVKMRLPWFSLSHSPTHLHHLSQRRSMM